MPSVIEQPEHQTTGPAQRPYVPSGVVMRRIVNPITVLLGGPTLVVPGRRSGRPIATPVPAFPFEGDRYLVAGGGETHWVRNLRAAGGAVERDRAGHIAPRAGRQELLEVILARVEIGNHEIAGLIARINQVRRTRTPRRRRAMAVDFHADRDHGPRHHVAQLRPCAAVD